MLKLSDLADKIAPHLIGVSTPFGGALAKNYIGADITDSDDTLPTGEDLDKVKADTQAGIDKANAGVENVNQQITNLKNEMENVGFKVMSHIPDLSNGKDLDASIIKDLRTAINTYVISLNQTNDPYISLDKPVTQTAPLMLPDKPYPCQIQIQVEVHDYPAGAIPWYYFRLMPFIKITAIRVKLADKIVNSFIQFDNDIQGNISEGMVVPFNKSIAHLNIGDWGGSRNNLLTPPSSITELPSRVDYTDPRDGKNYNDTPSVMAVIPYGDWKATNNNGSWELTEGTTAGGLYIAVYKGPCICYDLKISNMAGGSWTKRYGKMDSTLHLFNGLQTTYIGPNGQETITYK